MVFQGNLSHACGPCRNKRRRCDRVLPGCGQCRRAKITCGGYRDWATLCLRDESLTVAQKVQQSKQPSPSNNRTGHASTSASRDRHPAADEPPLDDGAADRVAVENPPLVLAASPNRSPENVALTYFLTAYSQSNSFGYLPDVYNDSSCGGGVSPAITACAVAALSLAIQQPGLMALARKHYAKALTHTNAALRSPSTAMLDGTLASVLLLSSFEAMAFRGRRSPESWTAHVEGSVALLLLRGDAQFDSVLGRKLFVQAASNIRLSCIQRIVRVPPELSALEARVDSHLDAALDIRARVSAVLDSFALLRVGLEEEGPSGCDYAEESMTLAARVDAILALFPAPRPIDRTMVAGHDDRNSPAYTYGPVVHEYDLHRDAVVANGLRILRLVLGEWIYYIAVGATPRRPRSSPTSTTTTSTTTTSPRSWMDRAQEATEAVERTMMAILASTPYLLGLGQSRASPTVARALIWPLAHVAESRLAPASARLYALDRLEFLNREMGLPQAGDAVDMLGENKGMGDW